MAHLDALKEWLKQLDETQLCDLLDISSEDIIDRFEDLIHDRRKYIESEMEVVSLDDDDLNFDDE